MEVMSVKKLQFERNESTVCERSLAEFGLHVSFIRDVLTSFNFNAQSSAEELKETTATHSWTSQTGQSPFTAHTHTHTVKPPSGCGCIKVFWVDVLLKYQNKTTDGEKNYNYMKHTHTHTHKRTHLWVNMSHYFLAQRNSSNKRNQTHWSENRTNSSRMFYWGRTTESLKQHPSVPTSAT